MQTDFDLLSRRVDLARDITEKYNSLCYLINSRRAVVESILSCKSILDFKNKEHAYACLREVLIKRPPDYWFVDGSYERSVCLNLNFLFRQLHSLKKDDILYTLGECPVCTELITIKQNFERSQDVTDEGELSRITTNILNLLEAISNDPEYGVCIQRKFEKWEEYANVKRDMVEGVINELEEFRKISQTRTTGKDFKKLVIANQSNSNSNRNLESFLILIRTLKKSKTKEIIKLLKKAICLYNALYPGLITVGIFSLVGFLAFVTPALVIRLTMLHISNILLITSASFIAAAGLICSIFFNYVYKKNCTTLDERVDATTCNIFRELTNPLLSDVEVMTEPMSQDIASNYL